MYFLHQGNSFILAAANVLGDENMVSVSYKDLPREVEPGTIVLLADGPISLRIVNAKEFPQVLQDGMLVTVDAVRGLACQGGVNVIK